MLSEFFPEPTQEILVCPTYKYDPDVVGQPLRCESDSVEFWARKYKDPNENLYLRYINGPHTDDSLDRLFYWKIGAKDYKQNIVSVNRNFISKRSFLDKLPRDISAHEFLVEQFPAGGAIYRIFLLHCYYPNRFPIYDQHVHRTMNYFGGNAGGAHELAGSDRKKVDCYIRDYLPFYEGFAQLNLSFEPETDGVRQRKIDRALWWFGKCLKKVKSQT